MKPAILIVGHGSRDREGTQEFQQLVDLLAPKTLDVLSNVVSSNSPNRSFRQAWIAAWRAGPRS